MGLKESARQWFVSLAVYMACIRPRQFVAQEPKGLFTLSRDSELPLGNDCPGARVTSRSHDDLLSRGNVAPGQVHRNLITTNSFESL